MPNQAKDGGIVLGEAPCGGETKPPRRRNEVSIEIDGIVNDAVVRGLVDDWLVPTIVDQLIGALTNSIEGEV